MVRLNLLLKKLSSIFDITDNKNIGKINQNGYDNLSTRQEYIEKYNTDITNFKHSINDYEYPPIDNYYEICQSNINILLKSEKIIKSDITDFTKKLNESYSKVDLNIPRIKQNIVAPDDMVNRFITFYNLLLTLDKI
jgi:hypothetical protein